VLKPVSDRNPLIPKVATIESILDETPDIKTFRVAGVSFEYRSGQCAMLSKLGVGEAMISITSSPTRDELEFSIKRVGRLTEALHEMKPGMNIGMRGPYGNSFPIENMIGKDLVFIGGGIGLAPLRSLINNCFDNREQFGRIVIIYGARSPEDLVFRKELFDVWPNNRDTEVHLTVDKGDDDWRGRVGFVPALLEDIGPSPENAMAVTCGPPIMIKFVLKSLQDMGFASENIITTLEMKMKCGIGKCGRCNIGEKYVCVDGPVFRLADLVTLPDEL
jgi:NAD(P)H-flavin reductase